MSREIDRKIAELMNGDIKGWDWKVRDGVKIGVRKNELYFHIPYYSSDWNAMRLLVEWLQGKGYLVKLEFHNDWDSCASIYELDNIPGKKLAGVVERTMPLALCQAVLSLPPEVLNHD